MTSKTEKEIVSNFEAFAIEHDFKLSRNVHIVFAKRSEITLKFNPLHGLISGDVHPIAVGGIKTQNPLKVLKRLWEAMTPRQRRENALLPKTVELLKLKRTKSPESLLKSFATKFDFVKVLPGVYRSRTSDVEVVSLDDGSFIASVNNSNIVASGDTPVEALARLGLVLESSNRKTCGSPESCKPKIQNADIELAEFVANRGDTWHLSASNGKSFEVFNSGGHWVAKHNIPKGFITVGSSPREALSKLVDSLTKELTRDQ